ncbi:hypothetical protein WR25_04743 [Diploscapter pachys]|uniref:Uncharacterized protein n=1 Tax=Diploscapter pachys TaxID=2018661 RepID=A0A2A2KI40_9BILA|nr:hypothetical protein WR25_04743 [Diploscapter pachys]
MPTEDIDASSASAMKVELSIHSCHFTRLIDARMRTTAHSTGGPQASANSNRKRLRSRQARHTTGTIGHPGVTGHEHGEACRRQQQETDDHVAGWPQPSVEDAAFHERAHEYHRARRD